MVPFKDILLGQGGGEIKIGKFMEMRENLYSLLFVSLIRQDYIDACEISHFENNGTLPEHV